MAVEKKIPYHCSFLLNKEGGGLRLALAWRRVGNKDYGLYLSSDSRPASVLFMASYSPKGEMESFLVSDHLLREGDMWDEDHLHFEREAPAVESIDAERITELANEFCDEWLESYGSTIANKLLMKLCESSVLERRKGLRHLLDAELPMQVRPEKMPDILAEAELTDRNFLYVFLPHSHGAPGGAESESLLESKMRLFFELI